MGKSLIATTNSELTQRTNESGQATIYERKTKILEKLSGIKHRT